MKITLEIPDILVNTIITDIHDNEDLEVTVPMTPKLRDSFVTKVLETFLIGHAGENEDVLEVNMQVFLDEAAQSGELSEIWDEIISSD